MNFKKISAVLFLCVFVMTSVTFAARGGARMSAPRTTTNSLTTQKQVSEPTTKNTQSKDYKPSTDAKSLTKDAPGTSAKANAAAAATKSSTPWGGMMRNIGLLAGGMFLGSMLSSMFGMGGLGGVMSDIMGLLMNVVIFGAVFMIGRMLWNKFRGRSKEKDDNVYRHNYKTAMRQQPQQEEPQKKIIDITPSKQGYEAKSKADEYRRR
jgi:predicted lipid-binding transport protein (Tim44 family)